MHQKTPDELVGTQRHYLPAATVPVVPPFEGDGVVFNLQNAVVGDGDAVRIAAEIFYDTGRILKRRLAVDHPLLLVAEG